MQKSEIVKGTEYAMRERPKAGIPFQHVRVLEHIRGNKWKAEWIDPNPGLVHYAESGQIVCPWKKRKAFLQEEENLCANHCSGLCDFCIQETLCSVNTLWHSMSQLFV